MVLVWPLPLFTLVICHHFTDFSMQNIGIDYIGKRIEQVTGLTLGEYFQKQFVFSASSAHTQKSHLFHSIFEPLGITNVFFGRKDIPNLSDAHIRVPPGDPKGKAIPIRE